VCIGLNAHPRRTAVINGGSPVSRSIEHDGERERERGGERGGRGRTLSTSDRIRVLSRVLVPREPLSLSRRRRSADPKPRLSSSRVSLMRFDRRGSFARAPRFVVIVGAAPARHRAKCNSVVGGAHERAGIRRVSSAEAPFFPFLPFPLATSSPEAGELFRLPRRSLDSPAL